MNVGKLHKHIVDTSETLLQTLNMHRIMKFSDCGNVDNFQHGEVAYLDGTTYGATLFFYCRDTYVMVGAPIASCNSEGQWSSIPVCHVTCELYTLAYTTT